MAKGTAHLWTIKVLGLIFANLALAAANAADLSEVFTQANKLYEQGKYPEAAAAYESLVKSNGVSPAVYFNLGNALFKTGKIGPAIVNYRLAERLAPRDPDIRANLQFARGSVSDGSRTRVPRWTRLVNFLSMNEIALAAAASAWIWICLLILKQLQPRMGDTLRGYASTAGFVTLVTGVWLGVLWHDRFRTESAVVVVPEAVVRYGPLEESQSFYTLHDGNEITVLNRLDNWLQVQDTAKRIGWVQLKQVFVLPAG